MNALLTKYSRTIDQLPQAARAMTLAAVLGFIFIAWYYGFWQDLQLSITTTSNKIKLLVPTTSKLEEQIKALEKDLKTRKETLSKNNGILASSSAALLSAHQTSKLLRDMLASNSELNLLELKNSPPKEASLPQSNLKIFEHGIMLKFSGNYFSTMKYLQAIEKLKWKFFWDKLEYNVVQYPIAEVTLYLHTISTEGDWIHV